MADAFLDAATEDRARADALLAADPGLATASPWHAIVLGEADAVTRALAGGGLDPRRPDGPLGLPPLAYACYSRYAQRGSPRAPGLLETARRLLGAGADPAVPFELPRYPNNPFSCLYGASGYNDNPALTRLLLDAGAPVDDGESVYHSTEHDGFECLRLLLARGPRLDEHVLKHMLDRESVEGVALLLDAGAPAAGTNGRGETSLHWAVWRDRSPEVVRLLLARGAPLDGRRVDGRTAYALAMVFTRAALAGVLRDAGADTALSPVDRYVVACSTAAAAGQPPPADPPAIAPTDAHLLPDLANANQLGAVAGLLAAGAGIHERGEHGATPLHFACWNGADRVVALLVGRGADLTLKDRTFSAPPAGWLVHGAAFCPQPQGDYAAALRTLLDAGAPLTVDEPTGRAEVDAVLRERGLLQ
jgi:ankyrin repeat protein